MSSLLLAIAVVLGLVFFAAAGVWLGLSPRFAGRAVIPHRVKAEGQFSSYKATVSGNTVALDGKFAKVLSTSESLSFHNFKVHDYVLTLVAVSPEGQYFLFKSNENGQPFVKLLEPAVAKRLVKAGTSGAERDA